MFRTVLLSIIRSLFTVHSAIVYFIQVYHRMELQFHPGTARKLPTNLYDIPFLSVQWINSWWWIDELSEICRVSWQNKFVKLVHLVSFITEKFVTMHAHRNVTIFYPLSRNNLNVIRKLDQFTALKLLFPQGLRVFHISLLWLRILR